MHSGLESLLQIQTSISNTYSRAKNKAISYLPLNCCHSRFAQFWHPHIPAFRMASRAHSFFMLLQAPKSTKMTASHPRFPFASSQTLFFILRTDPTQCDSASYLRLHTCSSLHICRFVNSKQINTTWPAPLICELFIAKGRKSESQSVSDHAIPATNNRRAQIKDPPPHSVQLNPLSKL
jgi:hypothetical protein